MTTDPVRPSSPSPRSSHLKVEQANLLFDAEYKEYLSNKTPKVTFELPLEGVIRYYECPSCHQEYRKHATKCSQTQLLLRNHGKGELCFFVRKSVGQRDKPNKNIMHLYWLCFV